MTTRTSSPLGLYHFSPAPAASLAISRRLSAEVNNGQVRLRVCDLGEITTSLGAAEAQALARWLTAHFPRSWDLGADEPRRLGEGARR